MPPNPASDSDADDTAADESPTPDRDERAADRPLCRIFGGPTSHRVQYGNGESRPATSLDAHQGGRQRPDAPSESPTSRPKGGPHEGGDSDPLRTAGGRAISAVLERRRAALEPTLDSLGDACWQGDSPDPADVRAARSQLAELEIAIEEYVARACPETDPWESIGEHVPERRLVELLEDGEGVEYDQGETGASSDKSDSGEPGQP